MVLGNKCDMNDRREVTKDRGSAFAVEYGVKFMETSAKLNVNVEDAFITLARDIKVKMDKKLDAVNPVSGKTKGQELKKDSQRKYRGWLGCIIL